MTNATSKRNDLQIRKELAEARYRQAELQVKLCSCEVKQAEEALQAASIYVSRVRWIIDKSDHKDVLSSSNPTFGASSVLVHSDGGEFPSNIAVLSSFRTFSSCVLRRHQGWTADDPRGLTSSSRRRRCPDDFFLDHRIPNFSRSHKYLQS